MVMFKLDYEVKSPILSAGTLDEGKGRGGLLNHLEALLPVEARQKIAGCCVAP